MYISIHINTYHTHESERSLSPQFMGLLILGPNVFAVEKLFIRQGHPVRVIRLPPGDGPVGQVGLSLESLRLMAVTLRYINSSTLAGFGGWKTGFH